MKLLRREVQQRIEDILFVQKLPGKKFSYALERNLDKLNSEHKKEQNYYFSLQEEIKKLPDYEKLYEFEDKKHKFLEKMKTGSDVDLGYTMESLNNDYPEELKVCDDYDSKVDIYLNEEVEIDFYLMKEDMLPDNISLEQRKRIKFLMEEEKKIKI